MKIEKKEIKISIIDKKRVQTSIQIGQNLITTLRKLDYCEKRCEEARDKYALALDKYLAAIGQECLRTDKTASKKKEIKKIDKKKLKKMYRYIDSVELGGADLMVE